MEVLILLIIALGLSMDCFSMGIANSTVSGHVKPGIPLRTSLMFAISHFILFFGGHQLGLWFQPMMGNTENWVAFIIFLFIGLKMISEARRKKPEAKVVDINNTRVMLLLSLAIGIDAMLVGLALGLMTHLFLLPALVIAFLVFVFTLGGMAGGKNLGLPFAKRTAIFGGLFMFIVAFSILADIFM